MTTEKLYTLSQAKEILEHNHRYFIKQKLMGAIALLIGFTIPFIPYTEDCGIGSLILIPIGMFLLFTKQKVITE